MADTGSAQSMKNVVPHDTNEVRCRGIYVGGTGNISVIGMEDTVPATFYAVPAGTTLAVSARVIRATGTTATNMVALA